MLQLRQPSFDSAAVTVALRGWRSKCTRTATAAAASGAVGLDDWLDGTLENAAQALL